MKPKNFLLSILAVVSVVFLSSCSGNGTQSTPVTASDGLTIKIVNFEFPAVTKVKKGETVKWINEDSMAHNVVFETISVQSPMLGRGQSFSHKFEEVGEFSYKCSPHPFMVGKIVVEE